MTLTDWKDLARAAMRRDQGQTMAEYGVVLAVIAIGAVATFTALSVSVSGVVGGIARLLPR